MMPNTSTGITPTTSPPLSDYLPTAKLGGGLNLYVLSSNGINYFSLSAVTNIAWGQQLISAPRVTVYIAHQIDSKMDDGRPTTGTVTARYLSSSYFGVMNSPFSQATADSNTCLDTTTDTYSITQNNGAGSNCALSFKFQ